MNPGVLVNKLGSHRSTYTNNASSPSTTNMTDEQAPEIQINVKGAHFLWGSPCISHPLLKYRTKRAEAPDLNNDR